MPYTGISHCLYSINLQVFLSFFHCPAFIGEWANRAMWCCVDKVKEIKRVLKSFMMKLQARDAKERLAMEWRLVALALDRMFFVLYVSTIVAFFVTSTLIYQIHSIEFADTVENIIEHIDDMWRSRSSSVLSRNTGVTVRQNAHCNGKTVCSCLWSRTRFTWSAV